MAEPESSLSYVVTCVRERYNVDLGVYRRRFLARRLGVRMRVRQIADAEAYGGLLVRDPAEYEALLRALDINHSFFMRDEAAYGALKAMVIPALIAARRQTGFHQLAVWSAGCAGGEEPYSLAMLVHGALGDELPQWRVHIHAMDRSADALAKARAGTYSSVSFQDPDAGYVGRHFTRDGDVYALNPEIRAMVTWQHGDIRHTPMLTAYDLILCRNVLIYYVRDRQEEIVAHLVRHLDLDGFLMLGMAEMLSATDAGTLSPIDGRLRIYRRSSGTGGEG